MENKVLGCWCKPSQPCHADVLIKLFNEKKNDEVQDNMVVKNINKKNMKYKRLIDMHWRDKIEILIKYMSIKIY